MADRVFDIKREFQRAVDLGCSRGYLSRHIMAESVKHLTICDLSPSMLAQAKGTPGLQMSRLEMDEEKFQVVIYLIYPSIYSSIYLFK